MAVPTEQDDQGLNQGCGEDDRFKACVGESVSDGFQAYSLGGGTHHPQNARRGGVGDSNGLSFDRRGPVNSPIDSSRAQEGGLGIITRKWLLRSEIS